MLFFAGILSCNVSLSRYRGNFQVVANVHSVHVFLWDGIGAVQISQQTCWLQRHKTNENLYLD